MTQETELPTEAFGVPVPRTWARTIASMLQRNPSKSGFVYAALKLLEELEALKGFDHDPTDFRAFIAKVDKEPT